MLIRNKHKSFFLSFLLSFFLCIVLPAGAQKSFISGKLPEHFCSPGGIPIVDVVDGQLIVHPATTDQIAGPREDGRHYPCRTERNNLQTQYSQTRL
jgi:hypothetical protein